MKLTSEEEDMLHGSCGEGTAMAMEILTGIGEVMEADRLVPVSRAHVSLSNQEGDLWFAEKMLAAGSLTRICATVNPGFDTDYFKNGWASERDLELTERCKKAYREMGFVLNFTCTPYFDGNLPRFREICAFSESSATAFVNSVLGARTNPESAQSAICSAITGLTPRYGLLLDKNRRAGVRVNVECEIRDEFGFTLLGWAAAKRIGRDVPLFCGSFNATTEGLLNLGAEMNTAGRVPLFHVEGATPEADLAAAHPIGREFTITKAELDETAERLRAGLEKADGVMLGCPHYSMEQILRVRDRLAGRRAKIPFFILTSASTATLLSSLPAGKELHECGVELVGDTCIDQPCWEPMRGKTMLTDSQKCSYYASRRGIRFSVMPVEDCIDAAAGRIKAK